MANHGMLYCVCWKSQDWRPDILWSRPDSCNLRGKLRRNRKGIFTVCPTAVYPTAASSLGNSSHRRRPRHPGRRQRRSNIAGKQAVISKSLTNESLNVFSNHHGLPQMLNPSIPQPILRTVFQCVTCDITVDDCCEKKLNRYGMHKLFARIISVSLTRIAFGTAPRTPMYSGSFTTTDFPIGLTVAD